MSWLLQLGSKLKLLASKRLTLQFLTWAVRESTEGYGSPITLKHKPLYLSLTHQMN